MFLRGERIAVALEDGCVLFFDYSPLWGGLYVLDGLATPMHVIEAGRTSVRHSNHNRVWDEDLKMFFRADDDTQEVNEALVVHVGIFNPDAPNHKWSSNCTIPGGVVVSTSLA